GVDEQRAQEHDRQRDARADHDPGRRLLAAPEGKRVLRPAPPAEEEQEDDDAESEGREPEDDPEDLRDLALGVAVRVERVLVAAAACEQQHERGKRYPVAKARHLPRLTYPELLPENG